MESALAWVGEVANWFGRFIPRYQIVRSTHAAVKWVKGSKVVSLGPGVHWYWPWTTEFEEFPTVRQAVTLAPQTLVTMDDKRIVVGGLLVYKIVDIQKALAETYDTDDTIKDIALAAIHDVLCRLTWDELKTQQRSGELDRALRREAKKGLDAYGVQVIRTTLTDLAPCHVIKLLGAETSLGSVGQQSNRVGV